jgi:uncharacterized protein CbrC (UPF0167 family)
MLIKILLWFFQGMKYKQYYSFRCLCCSRDIFVCFKVPIYKADELIDTHSVCQECISNANKNNKPLHLFVKEG